jgi:hypothetical protein
MTDIKEQLKKLEVLASGLSSRFERCEGEANLTVDEKGASNDTRVAGL